MNQPRPWAGAFAVVYKGIDANGRDPFAVRVFTTESPERRERYGLISAYLRTRKLRCLVDFEYRDRSIRSAGDGKWYPLIVMEWVQGETLFKWARARCLEGNRGALAAVAAKWVELVNELNQAAVAHGDLQHANVMVTDAGEVKLVDYDCMCVPSLVGRRNLEVGVEPYQHPSRNERTLLSLDLDNFSALMIHVALRALAADPSLWGEYIERTGYDKLLFRLEDLQDPPNSAVYRDLRKSPDHEVRELTDKLFSLFRASMDQIPPLSELANSFAKVEQLLVQNKWGEAVEILNRRGQFRDAPEHLKPLIRQAYEQTGRQQAWNAFRKLPPQTSEMNDRQLVDAWNEKLFSGFEPAERQRVRVAEARRRVTLLDRLYHLIQQSAGEITLAGEKAIADMAKRLVQGYQYDLQARVERARRCVNLITRLETVLGNPVSEAAIVAAWRAVEEAKREGLAREEWRPRIELAERRAPVLKILHGIPDDLPARRYDRKLLEAWDEELLSDCREADRWREDHSAAATRQAVLDRLKTAVDAHDEVAINALVAEPVLAGFPLPAAWAPAIKQARRQRQQAGILLAALRDGQQEALHKLFDIRVVRLEAKWFSSYESALRDWVASEVLPPEKLGLRPVRWGGVKAEKATEGTYRLRWTWPEPRLADRCLLAICPSEPAADDDPRQIAVHYRTTVDRQAWDAAGGSLSLETQADWLGGFLVVWAVVDLGFDVFYSAPVVLGVLGEEPRSKWKPWQVFAGRRAETAEAGEDAQ